MLVDCVRRYCYCGEKKYYPFDDPRDFAYRIEVKENAPDLLRRARFLTVTCTPAARSLRQLFPGQRPVHLPDLHYDLNRFLSQCSGTEMQ